ncbi:MAG TPA: class I SAM-dependent methyltransferase [Nitrososphaeraceae archaeon]|jgi:SAM-dependent methyltransferase|nr:class I SAM-dependent methyltransferase [Nitrososphaeraceae archaeon]
MNELHLVMDSDSRGFPEWDSLYRSQQVETMPWYNEKLDSDLEEEISEQNDLHKGRFLDLGTGPATQAVQIARKGYFVTGSDISQAAIRRAKEVYGKEQNVIFVVDNILNSNFKENEYDYIFDRGCFHVLDPSDRLTYVREIKRILKGDGILFLKCFSINEKREEGPYRFSKKQISEIFEKGFFKVIKIKDTVYQGTLDPLPVALFVVIKKSKKR